MIRGWCPSLFEPMESGDGMLVRIKPRAGGMDADTLRGVAGAAARFGNGVVNLTGRANLQMRGLSERTIEGFATAVLALGAADAEPAAERRRNVVVSPLAGDDPAVAAATVAVAAALEAGLAAPGAASLDGLSGKFGFVVDGGGVAGLGSMRGDVVVRVAGAACTMRVDGGGKGLAVEPGRAAEAALALARAFLALGGRPGPGERDAGDAWRTSGDGWPMSGDSGRMSGDAGRMSRMRDLVAARGEAAVFAAAALPAGPGPDSSAAPGAAAGGRSGAWRAQGSGDAALDAARQVGAIRYAGTDRGAFAAAPAFGQVDADALHALAGLAERFGDGRVRLSPWRTLLVGGVAARDLAGLGAACEALGLIVAAGDPRLAVATCPGRPRCASGEAATLEDAPVLAALLGGRRPGGVVHLSGCAKGCAHPGPAALVLVGEPGGYGVLRHGRASDRPERRLASIEAALAWAEAGGAGRPDVQDAGAGASAGAAVTAWSAQ